MFETSKIKTYRDLVVWQKSMALVTEIYKATKSFPKDEIYSLISQMRRCAISIPSNIAEGFGRKSTNDYIRFLNITMDSLYELQTQLEISLNLRYTNEEIFNRFFELSREIERMLGSMIKKITDKDKS